MSANPVVESLVPWAGVWSDTNDSSSVESWSVGVGNRQTLVWEKSGAGPQGTRERRKLLILEPDSTPGRTLESKFDGRTPLAMVTGGALWTIGLANSLRVERWHAPSGGVSAVLRADGQEQTMCQTRVKQVICYRRDLKMRKGKIAAQCAHASMAVLLRRDSGDDEHVVIAIRAFEAAWIRGAFAKVVLSVESEEALLAVAAAADEAGLPQAVIMDSGRTEFGGVPTRTAVAIGPAPAPWIDKITGPEGTVQTTLA